MTSRYSASMSRSFPDTRADAWHNSSFTPPLGMPTNADDAMSMAMNNQCTDLDLQSIHEMMRNGQRVKRWKGVTNNRHDTLIQASCAYNHLWYQPSPSAALEAQEAGTIYWNHVGETTHQPPAHYPLAGQAACMPSTRHGVKLKDISEIILGKEAQVFQCPQAQVAISEQCCSILTDSEQLDLEFESAALCCAWLIGLTAYISRHLQIKPVPTPISNITTAAGPSQATHLHAPEQRTTACRYSLAPSRMTRFAKHEPLQLSASAEREVDVQTAYLLAAQHDKQRRLQTQLQVLRAEHLQLRSNIHLCFNELWAQFQSNMNGLSLAAEHQAQRVRNLEHNLQQERNKRMIASNKVIELQGNIRVFCRVRPFQQQELSTERCAQVVDECQMSLCVAGQQKEFNFDHVFDCSASQAEVYEEVSPFVQSVVDGFAMCFFAYGQTGAGKTWTMQGTAQSPGVTLRAMDDLFALTKAEQDFGTRFAPAQWMNRSECERLESLNDSSEIPNRWIYSISISALEIYNEQLSDLLLEPSISKANKSKSLEIKHGPKGIYVPDLTLLSIKNAADFQRLIQQRVDANRRTASTAMNEHSSRSHSVILIHVDGNNPHTGQCSNGRLLLIDLAGSERVSRSQVTGAQLKEAASINSSLSSLGTCLSALQNKAAHIPYRNSKLTHLLSDCLGGSAKAIMMCQISPASESAPESLCSLQFASRARAVELGAAKKTLVNVSSVEDANKMRQLIKSERAELERASSEALQRQQHAEESMRKLRARVHELEHNQVVIQASLAPPPTAALAQKGAKSTELQWSRDELQVTDENKRQPSTTSSGAVTRKRKANFAPELVAIDEPVPVAATFSSNLASLLRGEATSLGSKRERTRAVVRPPTGTPLPASVLNVAAGTGFKRKRHKSIPESVVASPASSALIRATAASPPAAVAITPHKHDSPANSASATVDAAKRRMQERKQRMQTRAVAGCSPSRV